MDRKLRRCCKSSELLRPCCVDRLTSLPDELLSRILSLLPTKDAAAAQVLSKRMRQAFPCITSLNFDDSSTLCKCHNLPRLVERFFLFTSFINNVLSKLSPDRCLIQFRLRWGKETCPGKHRSEYGHTIRINSFPYVKPARLNAWISYPLDNCGLRELDLSFHIDNSSECKLPPRFFNHPSLEVLKLDSNLKIGDVVETPLIRLPKLKVLNLRYVSVTEDDFLTRLLSGCPSLEDLVISLVWKKVDRLSISSHSLRRLVLNIDAASRDDQRNSALLHIETPNLQYLKYRDNLSHQYSVPHLNALVEAHITIAVPLGIGPFGTSSQIQLLSALSDVQHLSLLTTSAENIYFGRDLKDELPVFRNLTKLELGSFRDARRDIVLLLILRSSPLLEALVFPEGLYDYMYGEMADLESEGWRSTQATPPCFLTHLQRIELKRCYGFDHELNRITFFLSKALVLKDFVICISKRSSSPNLDQFESRLLNLPRASNSCSLIVNR